VSRRAAVVLALLAAATALAGDDDAVAETRRAWAALDDAKNPVPDEGGEKLDAWIRARNAALERFADAFGRTEWDAWKLPADKELLGSGLVNFHWLSRRLRRWDDARRALDACVARLPGDPLAARAQRELRVGLLLSSGDLDGAAAHCAAASATLAGHARALNDVALGDVRSALGDAQGAAAAYASAESAMASWDRKRKADDSPADDYAVRSAEESVRDDLAVRRSLLGRASTSLKLGPWIGAPTVDWTHLRGKVVLVLFCDRPGFYTDDLLADLDRLARSQAGRPLQVLAVVHPSGLPPAPAGRRVAEQVAAFRDQRKLSFPLAVMADADYERLLGSTKVDARLVVDAKRAIVHVSSHAPDHHAAFGIAEALAAKAAALPPAPK
jgi:hypothetical protein